MMSEDNDETHVTVLSANFYSHFQAKQSDITSRLDALNPSGSISETNTAEFTSLSSDVVKLRKDLVDATSYLPTYDQGKYEQQLKVLEETLSRYRAPKAKFTFKRKPAAPASQSSPLPASERTKHKPQAPSQEHRTIPSTTNVTLSSRSSAHLTLSSFVRSPDIPLSQPRSVSHSSDITLTNLQACIVNLFPSTSLKDGLAKSEPTYTITALHARALSRVILIMPPIEGSVLLHEIHDSVVIVGCHQFRMHDSTNTTVFLHVLSNPIIERSQDIRFGAYPTTLHHASLQSFSKRPSKHTMAQDFDWIKPSPSPNWSLLEPSASFEERLVHVMDSGVDGNEVESVVNEVLSLSRFMSVRE